ncbi:BTB/POZ domain-containing protein At5g60050 [Impatiens glandulifera]|uniref:BTB/POZ domain-containing protein At5g60050 n=1 Tax=Impatiens glandulifera TaxID=253017 RepID=UPI001FB0D763|nr:BTB/POZ domain-containing protein At5g60050 [Impatiens glandulifera]
MAAQNNHTLAQPYTKSKEVSAMIKQGFISDTFLSPSRSPVSLSNRLSLSPSHTLSPPPLPPPPPPALSSDAAPSNLSRQSPTLFEMMSEEHNLDSKQSIDARHKIHERVSRVLAGAPFRNPGNWGGFGDVKLTITGRDGYRVSMDVHRRVLADQSRFFADKLHRDVTDSVGGAASSTGMLYLSVEICDCDDVEVYVETVVLMYCDDLKKKLLGEDVSKVLGLLKVSASLMFDAGIESCLEYLEAIPWTEEEEEKVISQLNELNLHDYDSVSDVLQRVSAQPSTSSRADDIFSKLLSGVLQAKDEKARREIKSLISRLLKEEDTTKGGEISRDTLYHLSHTCLNSLILRLSEATLVDENSKDRGVLMGEISREADNMRWIVDILIHKKIGDEFVKVWADQKELAVLHSKIPTMYRHEISRITAELCIAIGRGQVLIPKEVRFSLLCTWLEALYEDFGWMRRACRSFDKKLVEDGLSQTILTLPLLQQQGILLSWFDRFVNKGDDCPNIQKAFEVWWRRSFVRQHVAEPQMQIIVHDYPN